VDLLRETDFWAQIDPFESALGPLRG